MKTIDFGLFCNILQSRFERIVCLLIFFVSYLTIFFTSLFKFVNVSFVVLQAISNNV